MTMIYAVLILLGIGLNFRVLGQWAAGEPDAGPGLFPVFLMCWMPFLVVAMFGLIWIIEKILKLFEGKK